MIELSKTTLLKIYRKEMLSYQFLRSLEIEFMRLNNVRPYPVYYHLFKVFGDRNPSKLNIAIDFDTTPNQVKIMK